MCYQAKILGRLTMNQSKGLGEVGETVWAPYYSPHQGAGIFKHHTHAHVYSTTTPISYWLPQHASLTCQKE